MKIWPRDATEPHWPEDSQLQAELTEKAENLQMVRTHCKPHPTQTGTLGMDAMLLCGSQCSNIEEKCRRREKRKENGTCLGKCVN